MKKFLALLLTLVMALSLVACGSSGEENTGDTTDDSTTEETGGGAADVKIGLICVHDINSGYDAAHIEGLTTACEELGITANADDPANSQVIFRYNIPEDETCYDAAVDLAEEGCNIIFSDSYGHQMYMQQAATDYPEVTFVACTGDLAANSGLDNYKNIFPYTYESRYVSGVVAGMKLNQMIEDGTITASWQTASGAPAGGWYVTYGVPTSNHEPRLQECTENSVTLKGLIPDADYTISLTPADGADVFGTVEASAKTPSGGRFDRYGATPSTTYISLWETPAEVNWDYRSLTTSKTSFSADEDIALCLELTRKEDSDDEITLLYVIRNANGEPVSDASAQLTWDQMWHERRHTSTIPNPGAAGEYTLEVYVNRQLLKSIDFAIS